LASLIESQLSTWQADMNSYKNESGEMHTNLKETRKNKDLYIVRSPVSGTIDQFTGIYKGSSLQVGQNVAIVSPNSALYIEVYVTPRNIGFLNVGMPVKVQIESFNYNEWGTIPGVVKEISSDYMTDDKGISYYKVKCQLKRNFLVLKKTNRRGYLKKGMTVNAHFLVTRCSLFNLLYQEIDEWANPSQYSSKEKTGKIKQNSNS
jgi:HlyD family secretion protein